MDDDPRAPHTNRMNRRDLLKAAVGIPFALAARKSADASSSPADTEPSLTSSLFQGAPQETSGVSGQMISLPQGGGALVGIGESFSPDPFTGTGNFSIPLALLPGRNGFQPTLGLEYSTGYGNGPFGLGWQMSAPSISRRTDKGVPRYHDSEILGSDESDSFTLSGADHLVAVSVPETGATRFRPRTEGLFAHIDWVRQDDDNYWRVRSKDGLTHLFGTPGGSGHDPATVADPLRTYKIFSWLLSETTDTFGNRIVYDYVHDTRGPADASRPWDQAYLKSIRYVDFDRNGETDYLVSINLIYDEDERSDAFSTHRAGFEIRTRFLCRRIEVKTGNRLVRTFELRYLDDQVRGGEREESDLPANSVTLLSQIRVLGHDGERAEALPPLDLAYTQFDPTRSVPEALNTNSSPPTLDRSDTTLVSLFSNGLPDIVQINDSILYWQNLGDGSFADFKEMDTIPNVPELADPGTWIADMDGDGRADLLSQDHGRYYALAPSGEWTLAPRPYEETRNVPTVVGTGSTRLFDLTGNGVIDALESGLRDNIGRPKFQAYFNQPPEGWTRNRGVWDVPEGFETLDFSSPRVKLADLTGDGLQDLVVVDQEEENQQWFVRYWPYMGHGRWGALHEMSVPAPDSEPAFTLIDAEGLWLSRVHFGDVDGDGVDDLVYFDIPNERTVVWINQAGNSWGVPFVISGTPQLTDILGSGIRLADMKGIGSIGVLWTRENVEGAGTIYEFLDFLNGHKPYLLSEVKNNLGAITKVGYTSSIEFFLADRDNPATRWTTTLPFPVQVVKRIESIDQISGGKLTSEFRYHHGHWDGIEQEFCGFGLVEQLDSETYQQYNTTGLHDEDFAFLTVDEPHFSPPTLTKTWFHQGPIEGEFGHWYEADRSHEFWEDDRQGLGGLRPNLAAILVGPPAGKAPQRVRDALRALRGNVLRTELFAFDDDPRQDRPYTVTESVYDVIELDAPSSSDPNRQCVFFPHLTAQRTTQWDRGDDPMTQCSFTDNYDAYGQPQRQVVLAVPRGRDFGTTGPANEPYLGSVTTTAHAIRDDDDLYLVSLVAEIESHEVLSDGRLALLDLYQAIRDGTAPRTLIAQSFNYYDGQAFIGLPLGKIGQFGALVRSECLVLTEAVLGRMYADATFPSIPPYLVPNATPNWSDEYPPEYRGIPDMAGYVFADGSDHRACGYFVQTGRTKYDFHDHPTTSRGLMLAARDALGYETTVDQYDEFSVLPVAVSDAAGMTTTAMYDYRVMQPILVTDPNGNRLEYAYSPLGRLEGTAVEGSVDRPAGDTIDRPSTRFEYDLLAFFERGQPVSTWTYRRQEHFWASLESINRDRAADGLPPLTDAEIADIFPVNGSQEVQEYPERFIQTREFFDGFGRSIQVRSQAEEVQFGHVESGGGTLPLDQADQVGTKRIVVGRANYDQEKPNVIVDSWQVYDNKGQVVEHYDPFFDTGWDFRPLDHADPAQRVSTFYDPRGRLIRTINPDGSEQRVIYGVPGTIREPELQSLDDFEPTPWETYTYDANDLAPMCKGVRNDGMSGPPFDLVPSHHYYTPTSAVVDAMDRVVLTIERNRTPRAGTVDSLPPVEEIRTLTQYDIRGNLLVVIDALNREAFRYTYDLEDRPLRNDSADAGTRVVVVDAAGNSVERRDSKGAIVLQAYDALHRPTRLWARDDAAGPVTPTLRQLLVYGDDPVYGPRQPVDRNHRGKLFKHYDEAGLLNLQEYDFKGNLLEKSRSVIADSAIASAFPDPTIGEVDWQIHPFRVDWRSGSDGSFVDVEGELLDPGEYRTSMRYDALNRTTLMTYPLDHDGVRSTAHYRFNRAGRLSGVTLESGDISTTYIADIAYNARGQRSLTILGNGLMTRYAYDPRNFLLAQMRTERFTAPQSDAYQGTGAPLEDVAYVYDLIGNVIEIRTRTPGSGVPGSTMGRDALDRTFVYDAVYRVVSANGRETDPPPERLPWDDRPRPVDETRTRRYYERYGYDVVGNLVRLEHGAGSDWSVRRFSIAPRNNRLTTMSRGQTAYSFDYDANGNALSEGTARHFEWDYSDQLKAFRTQIGGSEPSEHAHYLYDAAGQRVKKLVRKQGGQLVATVSIDDVFEYRSFHRGSNRRRNSTLHVTDGELRVATIRVGEPLPDEVAPSVAYRICDHLRSEHLVVDGESKFISREEFTPYGETSFGGFASKRFRFMGKERDEESGLCYHGARYYAPWLGRWANCDPIGTSGGLNLYEFTASNPVNLVDTTGLSPEGSAVQPENSDLPAYTTTDSGNSYGWDGEAYQLIDGDGEVVEISEHLSLEQFRQYDWQRLTSQHIQDQLEQGMRDPRLRKNLEYTFALMSHTEKFGEFYTREVLSRIIPFGDVAMTIVDISERDDQQLDIMDIATLGPGRVLRGARTSRKLSRRRRTELNRLAAIGREAHRQILAVYKKRGWNTEQRLWLWTGTEVRKDAFKLTKRGAEVLIIKPQTPSGIAMANARAALMKLNGYVPRIHYYDPKSPRWLPGSRSYIGDK